MTCSDSEDNLNKVSNMVGVDIVEDVEMAEVTLDSICNIFFQSRSKIQST